jgi:thiamine transport system substrate-binding protein
MRNLALHTIIPLLLTLSLAIAGCAPVATPPDAPTAVDQQTTITLASHDSFSISEAVIAAFEEEHNADVQFLSLGDAGEALNRMILSKDAPLADVFFGVDNTFLSRALDADLFLPYPSPLLDAVPDELELDPEQRLLPVDFGFVNINADRAWFEERNIALPQSLEDLARPEYAGLLVVQNPASSSPGLAFLLTTISAFGEEGYLDYWRSLRENDVLVTDGWSEAYFEHFTVGSGGTGTRPLVVSYTTSPPADVVYATDGRTEPASVNISPPGATFRQVEFVGILATTAQPELAKALVDFMLGRQFQEDIPLQMFVYPANSNAALPELFAQFATAPQDPVSLNARRIEDMRAAWIQAWTETVLR